MDFFDRYFELRARIAPFRLKTDYETVKTCAIIRGIADRASAMKEGALPEKSYLAKFFGVNGFSDAETILSWAEEYVGQLEKGEYPFKNGFTEVGYGMSDHTFIVKDGELHIIYNRPQTGYGWWERFSDTLGHASTTDLKNWTFHGPALSTELSTFGEYQVWSPGIVEKDGLYYMFYTGVNRYGSQAICMATSPDLFKWEKCKNNPVITPGNWGDWHEKRWSDCRDSFAFKDDDGTFYVYYFAKQINGGEVKPVIGISSSKNLIDWKDEGFIFMKCCLHDAESPYVLKRGGRYYMFFTNCFRGIDYVTSYNPISGWDIPEKGSDNVFIEGSVCASEIFEFNRKNYMTYIKWLHNEQVSLMYIREMVWNKDGTFKLGKYI